MGATRETLTGSPLVDLLFEEASVGRCLVAADGTVLRVNAEWIRITGRSFEDPGACDLSALFPDTRDGALALLARARAGQHVEIPRHPHRAGDRQKFWEGSMDPVELEGGAGVLVTAREVPPDGGPAFAGVLARLRAIADHAPAAVFVKDQAGRYLFANRWLRELLGLQRAAVVGRTVKDILPEPVAVRTEEHDRRVVAGQEVVSEETVPTPHGERVLMAVRFPFPLGEAELGIFGLAVDVTDARRAEAALRESEERFRLLAKAMPQIVCVLDADGRAEYVNPSWVAFSGLDLAATKEAGWQSVLHPGDLEAALACRRRALKLRTPQDVELRYRAADGSHRWFLSRLAPIVAGERVVRLVGAAMDIEDRKRAEATLREQLALQDQLAKVAASVPGVVCSFRLLPGGKPCMPFSAPAIEDLYGIPQEVLARDMTPAFGRTHPDDIQRVSDEIAASARDMTPWRSEFRYHHPTKGLRWMEGASIPTLEPDGSILWHGYVADVTDQKLAEQALRDANERLREADRRKDEFLGVLSHELRNPLAPLRHSVFVLRRGEPSQAGPALQVIERQVQHLARLVDDLLDVTRIARGKIQLRRERVDLREVVKRAGEDFRSVLEERGVGLEVALPAGPVWAEGDATRLAQVVGNLLHNAAKFCSQGDRTTLALEGAGARARIRVRDTGAGIDPALLPTVFDPFVQADRTLARTEGGLGLGLALVKGIVELHGGTVAVESAGHGEGATFTLELPLAAAEQERRSGLEAPRASAAGRRVLVVDDNRDAADSLAQLMGVLGHEVEVAYDGESALARARAHLPDVVLCDLGLPGLDGYEVARRLRALRARGLKLVAVSGYAQPEDVARAIAAGFDAHVAKPADPDRLAALVG